jgi:hypothetical protein
MSKQEYALNRDVMKEMRKLRPSIEVSDHELWRLVRLFGYKMEIKNMGNAIPFEDVPEFAAKAVQAIEGPFEFEGDILFNNCYAADYINPQVDTKHLDGTVWRRMRQGGFEPVRRGGRYYVTQDQLDEYIHWFNEIRPNLPKKKRTPHRINRTFTAAAAQRNGTRSLEENRRLMRELEEKAMNGEVEPIYIECSHKRTAGTALDRQDIYQDTNVRAWGL